VEQQGYKTCIALLKLADSYSTARLETACEKALSYSSCPSFRSIRTILKAASNKQGTPPPERPDESAKKFAFTRGNSYYGGKKDGE